MIFAQNQVEVAGTSYLPSMTFQLDAGDQGLKVAIAVQSNKLDSQTAIAEYGPVIVQFSESPQQDFEDNTVTEQFCQLGFYSKVPVTPITAIRFRRAGKLPALVDFVIYG